MPRRNNRKTGAKRKMPYKKAKQVVAKTNRKLKAKNMDTFAITLKNSALIIPIQGITTSNYLYNTFRLLDQATSTYSLVNNIEYNLYKNMYDQVRVNSLMIKVTPKANVLSQQEAQADSQNLVTGDGLVHTVIDRDGPGPWSISMLSKYPSYRKRDQKKPFTMKYSVKYPVGIWLDTANVFEDFTLLNRLGLSGGITMYAENLIEDANELINEPWADIHVYYNVVFRGKTNAQLSYNDDGSVTVQSYEVGTPPLQSTVITTGGSINNRRLISTDDTGLVTTNENEYSRPDA